MVRPSKFRRRVAELIMLIRGIGRLPVETGPCQLFGRLLPVVVHPGAPYIKE